MENFSGKAMSVAEFLVVLRKAPEQLYAVAGDESLLERLPKANWIGGTIPYLMTDELGGLTTRDLLLVQQLPSDERGGTGNLGL